MAKTESTAVNALIDLAGRKPIDLGDDSADLMFRSPAASNRAPAKSPRVTAPMPAMRGAGEIAPLPQQRAASGTQAEMAAVRVVTAPPSRLTTIPPIGGKAMPPLPTRASRTLPPPRPGTGGRAAEGTPAPELFSRSGATLPPPPPSGRTRAPTGMPVAAPFEPTVPAAPVVAAPKAARSQPVAVVDITNTDGWFEATREAGKFEPHDDDSSGTLAVPRSHFGSTFSRLALPGLLLAAGVAMVGGYFAFSGEGGKHPIAAAAPTPPAAAPAPAPAPVAAAAVAPIAPTAPAPAETAAPVAVAAPAAATDPAPAVAAPAAATDPAPAVAAPAAPAAAPAVAAAPEAPPTGTAVARLVNVRFDSRPAGATVMLVDGGKTSFLGTAPVDVAVDASRAYDVVFTLDGHPTQVQHLDASASQHVTATLGGQPAAPVAAAVVATPAVATTVPAPAPVAPTTPVHHHHAAPAAPLAVAQPAAPAVATKAAAGKGVLMVSSKPPCDIVIDGRPTGLVTPQRAISLPPGSHKVTLINAQQNLTKTVNVSIKPDQPTKLIQNLLQ